MLLDATNSTSNPSAVLRGHADEVTSLQHVAYSFGASGVRELLASGDASGNVIFWDTHLEEALLSVEPGLARSPVIAILQDPFSEKIFVQHKNGFVKDFSLHQNLVTSRLSLEVANDSVRRVFTDSFCAMKMLHRGVLVGPGGEERASEIELRDSRADFNLKPQLSFLDSSDQRGMVMCLDSNSASETEGHFEAKIVAGYENGDVATWDTRAPMEPLTTVSMSKEVILGVCCSPRGGDIVVAASAVDNLLAACGDEIIARGPLRKKGVGSICWRGDGRVIASGGWDGRVRVWDGKRNRNFLRRLGSLRWHDGHVQCVAFSHLRGHLASGGRDRTIALWRIYEDTFHL